MKKGKGHGEEDDRDDKTRRKGRRTRRKGRRTRKKTRRKGSKREGMTKGEKLE